MFKKLTLSIVATLALSAPALAAVITGPATLTETIFGHTNTGLSITANQNTVLDSFVYWNQGPDNTVYLRDANTGATLYSTLVITDALQQFVDVDWALEAGRTYFLMIDNANGWWTPYGSPSSNTDITVNTAFFSSSNFAGYWSSFTDITTGSTNSVPEPGSLALMGAALAGLMLRKKRA
jgi:hypothetical protein